MPKRTIQIFVVLLIILIGAGASYCLYKIAYQRGYDAGLSTVRQIPSFIQARMYSIKGVIFAISGNVVTVKNQKDSVNVLVKEDAGIFSFKNASSTPQNINFNQLKVEDEVSIVANVINDQNYEAMTVTVY